MEGGSGSDNGGDGNDKVYGDEGDDSGEFVGFGNALWKGGLFGFAGDDYIDGGGGNDDIQGGAGRCAHQGQDQIDNRNHGSRYYGYCGTFPPIRFQQAKHGPHRRARRGKGTPTHS